MTHLSLFSGIGGLDLAAEWAGMQTVGQCEWADYPTQVLAKHWPDVPRWRDIRTLTEESFYERTGLRAVDVISGGFPCQPFSVAGNQKGKGDDRYLWPEMLRVIRDIKPRWVVGENVPGILRIAATDVIEDLEREGYNVVVLDLEAAAIGAPHRRERIAFVANRKPGVMENAGGSGCGEPKISQKQPRGAELEWRGEVVANTDAERIQGRPQTRDACSKRTDTKQYTVGCGEVVNAVCGGHPRHDGRTTQPGVGGVVDGISGGMDRRLDPWAGDWEAGVPRVARGIPNRVNRIKCLGNAVVPQQFYPIFRAIVQIEKERET